MRKLITKQSEEHKNVKNIANINGAQEPQMIKLTMQKFQADVTYSFTVCHPNVTAVPFKHWTIYVCVWSQLLQLRN